MNRGNSAEGLFRMPESLELLPDRRLIQLRAAVEAEMVRRRLAFTVGAIGEQAVIDHFNTTRGLPTLLAAPPGTKNVDALSRDGKRYSIKTILKAKKTGTVYPDSDNPERQLFEYLLIAQLAADYSLWSIYRFGWGQFVELRSWDRRMNAWYLGCSKRVFGHAETILKP